MTAPIRSSDSNYGPTIRRMRGKVLDIRAQAEHWWHRCAGGDCVAAFWAGHCVNVVDTKLGPASPVQRWPRAEWELLLAAVKAGSGTVVHPAVDNLPDGGVRLGVEFLKHEPLTFSEQEWDDFIDGVCEGAYEVDRLRSFVGAAVSGSGKIVELSGPATVAASTGSGEVVQPTVPGRPGSSLDDEIDTIVWKRDQSLGEPQGPSKGAARRAGQGPDLADRSGVEAAGTGALPPALVPAAQADRHELPEFNAEAMALFREAYDLRGLYFAARTVAQWAYQAGWSDREKWTKAVAPLVPTDGRRTDG